MADDKDVPGVATFASLSDIQSCYLTLSPCGIRIDMRSGEVEIPDGLSLTDASRAFWEAVGHKGGGFW
jgi:hypothetical protein